MCVGPLWYYQRTSHVCHIISELEGVQQKKEDRLGLGCEIFMFCLIMLMEIGIQQIEIKIIRLPEYIGNEKVHDVLQ